MDSLTLVSPSWQYNRITSKTKISKSKYQRTATLHQKRHQTHNKAIIKTVHFLHHNQQI